jgi:hypothetical protein
MDGVFEGGKQIKLDEKIKNSSSLRNLELEQNVSL